MRRPTARVLRRVGLGFLLGALGGGLAGLLRPRPADPGLPGEPSGRYPS